MNIKFTWFWASTRAVIIYFFIQKAETKMAQGWDSTTGVQRFLLCSKEMFVPVLSALGGTFNYSAHRKRTKTCYQACASRMDSVLEAGLVGGAGVSLHPGEGTKARSREAEVLTTKRSQHIPQPPGPQRHQRASVARASPAC